MYASPHFLIKNEMSELSNILACFFVESKDTSDILVIFTVYNDLN